MEELEEEEEAEKREMRKELVSAKFHLYMFDSQRPGKMPGIGFRGFKCGNGTEKTQPPN